MNQIDHPDPMYYRRGWDDFQADPEKAKVYLANAEAEAAAPSLINLRLVNGYRRTVSVTSFNAGPMGIAYLAGIRLAMAGGAAPPQWAPADKPP
jgi:hypothetical protein